MKGRVTLLILLISSFFITITFGLLVWTINSPQLFSLAFLSDGWNLELNGEQYNNINTDKIRSIIFNKAKKGDVVSFSTVLPDIDNPPFPSLGIYTSNSAYSIFLDNQLIGSDFHKLYDSNDFIGGGYNFIMLPDDYVGKTLKIKLWITVDYSYHNFLIPMIGSYHDLRFAVFRVLMLPMLSGIFLCLFGGFFTFVSLIFFPILPTLKNQIYSSLFSLVFGLWMLGHFRLTSFFANASFGTSVEYSSLILLIPLALLLLCSLYKNKITKYHIIASIIVISISLTLILLHVLKIIFMTSTIFIVHIIGSIIIGLILYCRFNTFKTHSLSKSDSTLLNGISILSISLIFDEILYYASNSFDSIEGLIDLIIIPIAAFINAACIISNYYLYVTEALAQQQEVVSLAHLAYADGLTNLANRSKADKYIASLEKSNEDYTIISLDLNGLKTVNDELGHSAGDQYIREFALALMESFQEIQFTARIGGDEFVIISNITDIDIIQNYLYKVRQKLELLNQSDTKYYRSVAAGFAMRHEINSNNSRDVYLLADKRMYIDKQKIHEKMFH